MGMYQFDIPNQQIKYKNGAFFGAISHRLRLFSFFRGFAIIKKKELQITKNYYKAVLAVLEAKHIFIIRV